MLVIDFFDCFRADRRDFVAYFLCKFFSLLFMIDTVKPSLFSLFVFKTAEVTAAICLSECKHILMAARQSEYMPNKL